MGEWVPRHMPTKLTACELTCCTCVFVFPFRRRFPLCCCCCCCWWWRRLCGRDDDDDDVDALCRLLVPPPAPAPPAPPLDLVGCCCRVAVDFFGDWPWPEGFTMLDSRLRMRARATPNFCFSACSCSLFFVPWPNRFETSQIFILKFSGRYIPDKTFEV